MTEQLGGKKGRSFSPQKICVQSVINLRFTSLFAGLRRRGVPEAESGGGEDLGSFGWSEGAPGSLSEVTEGEVADLNAQQAERGMSDRGGHPANLTVLPFHQFECNPAVGNILPDPNWRRSVGDHGLGIQAGDAARPGAMVLDHNTCRQPRERVVRGETFHLGPIGPAMAVIWVEQARVQTGLVTE